MELCEASKAIPHPHPTPNRDEAERSDEMNVSEVKERSEARKRFPTPTSCEGTIDHVHYTGLSNSIK